MQNREYAAQYFVALRFSCSFTLSKLPAKSLARLVLLASCSVLLLSIQTRGGCVAICCQACVFPWSFTLSKLPTEKPRFPRLARIFTILHVSNENKKYTRLNTLLRCVLICYSKLCGTFFIQTLDKAFFLCYNIVNISH